jgi:hypothetical protein
MTHTCAAAIFALLAVTVPAHAQTAACSDGSTSYSANFQGTCSHHGGVAVWNDEVMKDGANQWCDETLPCTKIRIGRVSKDMEIIPEILTTTTTRSSHEPPRRFIIEPCARDYRR